MLCSSDQYALILSNILEEKWLARSRPNTLLAVHHQHPLRSWIEFEVVDPAAEFFPGPAPEFFRWVSTMQFDFSCLPVPWHSWGYPILPDFRNSLKILAQHCWLQLDVLADDNDSNWTRLVRHRNNYVSLLFSIILIILRGIIKNY